MPAPPEVIHWLETTFRKELRDNTEKHAQYFTALATFYKDEENPAELIVAKAIAGVVLDIAGLDPDLDGKTPSQN